MSLILGLESSCDETAAAVVRGGREVLSSVVHSQVEEHAPYGGVVPELAGRSHLRKVLPVVDRALIEAGIELAELDAIAVTQRPGLIGSLLVGLCAAKGLAYGARKPLLAIHHIEAHVQAAAMVLSRPPWPCLSLVVSGGHTALYQSESPLEHRLLASTLDDASGEAFDKVAWLLGLGYPGGPAIARLAREGRGDAIDFPRYRSRDGRPGFSFSGLKTAVLYHLRGGDAKAPTPAPEAIPDRADVAASFEEAAVDMLVAETLLAAEQCGLERVLVSGGVACNQRLRSKLGAQGAARGLEVSFPPPALCTDNGVMIAALGHEHLLAGRLAPLDVDASPR
jgi:N6-L-threonylcarbamoyladenine synthase